LAIVGSGFDTSDRLIEPVVGALLFVHGVFLLATLYGGDALEWGLLAVFLLVAGSAAAGEWSPLRVVVRSVGLLAAALGLIGLTGGSSSFFTLWLFALAPLYAMLLRTPWSMAYPVVAGTAYLMMDIVVGNDLPVVVLVGRPAVFTGIAIVLAILSERVAVASEQLAHLSRAKDEFVAAISHELRTPLTAVVGLSSLLASDTSSVGPHEIQDLASLVHRESMEVADIVDDLLVAARADIGRVSVAMAPVRIDRVIEDVLVELATRGIGPLEVVGAGGVVAVADGSRLRQILRNLIVNAARYGGPTVSVEVSSDQAWVSIAVKDNGPGLSWTEDTHLFEAFLHRRPASSQPESIGLGLYVSSELAKLMGGDLRYERKESRTSFIVRVPVAPIPVPVS
jgi:signal transduction histidine kinase